MVYATTQPCFIAKGCNEPLNPHKRMQQIKYINRFIDPWNSIQKIKSITIKLNPWKSMQKFIYINKIYKPTCPLHGTIHDMNLCKDMQVEAKYKKATWLLTHGGGRFGIKFVDDKKCSANI